MDLSGVIKVIEDNTKVLANDFMKELNGAKFTKTYHDLDDAEIVNRGAAVYAHLIAWLKSGASNDEAEKYFEGVGRSRFGEGFPLSEINYALYLEKKVFWNLICCKDELIDTLSTAEVMELMRLVSNYFDLGSFFLTQGYFYEFFGELDEGAVYSKDQLKDFLMKGIPDHKITRPDEIVWRHV